jgi:hypothetical protein
LTLGSGFDRTFESRFRDAKVGPKGRRVPARMDEVDGSGQIGRASTIFPLLEVILGSLVEARVLPGRRKFGAGERRNVGGR